MLKAFHRPTKFQKHIELHPNNGAKSRSSVWGVSWRARLTLQFLLCFLTMAGKPQQFLY